jgi:hypothetical protein
MSSKDAFIVPATPIDDDRKPMLTEDLEELRKIKNGIAKKLREAKSAKFMDDHPNIKKLKESLPVAQPVVAQPVVAQPVVAQPVVAQPGAIPRDKEEKPHRATIYAPLPEPAKPEPVKAAVSKPVNIPKVREIPAYKPHATIEAIVSNPNGRWF